MTAQVEVGGARRDTPNVAWRGRRRADLTVAEYASQYVRRLTRVLGIFRRPSWTDGLVGLLVDGWGDLSIATPWASDVSPDGSPLEFAVDLGQKQPSLQLAIEPMAHVAGRVANAEAAARMFIDRLATAGGAPIDRLEKLTDIFLRDSNADHVAMFGVEIPKRGLAEYKVWLYPASVDVTDPAGVVRAGLDALGQAGSWPAVVNHASRGWLNDQPMLFSLDLSKDPHARTKIYFRHHDTTSQELSRRLSYFGGFDASRTARVIDAVMGPAIELCNQPPVTCIALRPGVENATAVTLYMPLWIDRDDASTEHRIAGLLRSEGLPVERYRAVLHQVAHRSLGEGSGIHNYLSWQPNSPISRFKVYLSPEMRGINPSRRYGRTNAAGSAI